MTLRTRNILFYLVTALFFIITIAAIFYSNGWRFDPETFSINKLGGIYFEEVPDGSTLLIEKIGAEFNPNFLRSSYLASNLFPKTYFAEINKIGYQKWIKEIPVYPSIVTEIPPVILLSEKIIPDDPIQKNITDFWEKDGKIIRKIKSGELYLDLTKIPGTEVVAWSENADSVITRTKTNYYLVRSDNPSSALNLSLMFINSRNMAAGLKDNTQIRHINFYPGNSRIAVIHTDYGLYLLNSELFSLEAIAKSPVLSYAGSSSEIIFADQSGLYSYSSGKTATLTPSLPITNPTEIIFNDAETYFLLKSASGDLFLVDRNNLEAKLLANNARTALFAPGNLKLAFTTFNSELVIYTFGKKYQLLEKPKTEILRLSISDESSLAWHKDAAHIFMQYPNTAYLLEANEMPPINLQTIDSGVDKFQYDQEYEELYLLKKSSLYRISI